MEKKTDEPWHKFLEFYGECWRKFSGREKHKANFSFIVHKKAPILTTTLTVSYFSAKSKLLLDLARPLISNVSTNNGNNSGFC